MSALFAAESVRDRSWGGWSVCQRIARIVTARLRRRTQPRRRRRIRGRLSGRI